MRKPLLLILVISLICAMSGCVDTAEYSELYEAIERANAEKVYSNTFQFTIVNADTDATVCFSQGKANIDKTSALRMNGSMTQYVLGEYSSANIAYCDGEYYTEIGETKVVMDVEESSILSEFLCGDTPLFEPSDVKSLEVKSDGLQKTYTFTCRGNKEVLSKVAGEDVYVLVGALTVDESMTEYSDVKCVFVTTDAGDDSVLVSHSMKYTIHAYSKMPYLGGTKVDKEDYRTDIGIECSQVYTSFGNVTVTIPDRAGYTDYNETSTTSE